MKVKINRKKRAKKSIPLEPPNLTLEEFPSRIIPVKINGEEYKFEKRLADGRILLVKADYRFGYGPGNPLYDFLARNEGIAFVNMTLREEPAKFFFPSNVKRLLHEAQPTNFWRRTAGPNYSKESEQR